MKAMHVVIAAVLAAAIGAGAYWWWQHRDPPYLPPVAKPQPPAAPQGPQPPKHPVPQVEAKPLPALGASDAAIQPDIVKLLGLQAFERLVNPEDIIRRTVATVDNLPRDQVAQRLSPVRPVGGLVTTQGPQPPKHPVPQGEARPLPSLGASDAAIQPDIVKLIGLQAFERLVNPEDIIRRAVATVDNLPRDLVATRLNPVRPVGGLVTTQGREATLTLSPENSRRYALHVRALEAVDATALASVYFHFYPLFQQAYVELGYPQGHFNDRLVEVIDHLLAAPEVKGPIRLTTPKVLHEYADADLESRSAGQKVLIRMGPENAARVKAKLREVRAQVARGPAQ